MSGLEAERRAEAGRWLDIADQDIATARLCLNAAPPLPAVAAYHCQQAVEKITKALLVAAGADFPKTHDLVALGALASSRYPALSAALEKLAPITVWGFAYRYPPEEESGGMPAVAEVSRRLADIQDLRLAAVTALRSYGR